MCSLHFENNFLTIGRPVRQKGLSYQPASLGIDFWVPLKVYKYGLSTFSLGRGGGGQREDRGATVHKYSSFVHGSNSSQAGSKIPTNEWMYLQSIKSVEHNAAMYVSRSILKKSRIGLLQCNLSTGQTKDQDCVSFLLTIIHRRVISAKFLHYILF
jgi:hypothetical protein